MNIEVALQRYKDVFLPDVIDNSQGDFLAKHVPMRNLLLIVHELAHLRHMNHSAQFYALIEQYMPDYKVRRAMLK